MSSQSEAMMKILKFIFLNFKYIISGIALLCIVHKYRKDNKAERFLEKLQNEKNINKTKEIHKNGKTEYSKMIIDDDNQKVYYFLYLEIVQNIIK